MAALSAPPRLLPSRGGSGARGRDRALGGPGAPNPGGGDGGSIPHLERGEERKHLEPFCARPRTGPGCSAGILLHQPSAAATPGHGRRHRPPPGAGDAFLSSLSLQTSEGGPAGRAVPGLGAGAWRGGRRQRGLSNACGEAAGRRAAAAPGRQPAGSRRRRRGWAAGPRRVYVGGGGVAWDRASGRGG